MPHNWLKRGCGPVVTTPNLHNGVRNVRTRLLPRCPSLHEQSERTRPRAAAMATWWRCQRGEDADRARLGRRPDAQLSHRMGPIRFVTLSHRPHAPLLPYGESRAHNHMGSGRALPRVVPYGSNGEQSPLFSSAMHAHEPQPGQAGLPWLWFPSPRSKSVGRAGPPACASPTVPRIAPTPKLAGPSGYNVRNNPAARQR